MSRLHGARPALKEIHQRIGLDYFGIDCHLGEQGELQIFEVNATMNTLLVPEGGDRSYVEPIIDRIRQMIALRSGEPGMRLFQGS